MRKGAAVSKKEMFLSSGKERGTARGGGKNYVTNLAAAPRASRESLHLVGKWGNGGRLHQKGKGGEDTD